MYKHLRELWNKPSKNLCSIWQQRLIQWRKEPATVRLKRPTRIDKARSLGYRAKPGYIVIRQRVLRGGHRRPQIKGGRRSKHMRQRLILKKNYQQIAEERASKKFKNCEVLNSYFTAQDGMHYWYEVILVDNSHPAILADHRISWIADKHQRVLRGLTAAGKRGRGILTHKGKGAEKLRPSLRAHGRRGN